MSSYRGGKNARSTTDLSFFSKLCPLAEEAPLAGTLISSPPSIARKKISYLSNQELVSEGIKAAATAQAIKHRDTLARVSPSEAISQELAFIKALLRGLNSESTDFSFCKPKAIKVFASDDISDRSEGNIMTLKRNRAGAGESNSPETLLFSGIESGIEKHSAFKKHKDLIFKKL